MAPAAQILGQGTVDLAILCQGGFAHVKAKRRRNFKKNCVRNIVFRFHLLNVNVSVSFSPAFSYTHACTCVVLYRVQDILVYIAKEGVATADVFRRPGNPNDTRRIVKRLSEGKQVIYSNYSFYTLASVVKVSKKKS